MRNQNSLLERAGYDEQTDLPALHRETQMLLLRSGTTNELLIDLLYGLRDIGSFAPLKQKVDQCVDAIVAPLLRIAIRPAVKGVRDVTHHPQWSVQEEQDGHSAPAERLAAREINRIADLDSHGAYVLVWDCNCLTLFDYHAVGAGAADDEPVLDGFVDVL